MQHSNPCALLQDWFNLPTNHLWEPPKAKGKVKESHSAFSHSTSSPWCIAVSIPWCTYKITLFIHMRALRSTHQTDTCVLLLYYWLLLELKTEGQILDYQNVKKIIIITYNYKNLYYLLFICYIWLMRWASRLFLWMVSLYCSSQH